MIFYWASWLLYKVLFTPLVFIIASFLVMVYCHVSVYLTCRRHVIQIKSEQVSSDANTTFLKERKAWKTAAIIIAGVIMSFSPGVTNCQGI